MKDIFVTRQISEKGLNFLKEKGYNITIGKTKNPPSQKEIIKQIKGKNYDAIITLLTDKIDNNIFNASPNTKLFANYATGYDNFNLKEATEKNITITNSTGDYSESVAQHTVALLLSLMARLVEADKFVRNGKYKGFDPMLFIGSKLRGKTAAIIGSGKIGEHVAQMLHLGFGVKIIYHDMVKNEKIEKECNAKFINSIDEALAISDIVSLHVPLLESTHHLLNKESFKKMKPSAYLINTSRGAVIDEHALVDALKNGEIKAAGLDVYEFEPKIVRGLTKLSNVVLSPHIASAQIEAREEMSMVVAENIIDFFEGRIPKNKVN